MSNITGPSSTFDYISGWKVGLSSYTRVFACGFSSEINYSFQGARYTPTGEKMDLQYLNLSEVMHVYPFRDGDVNFYFGLGIGLNYLTSARMGGENLMRIDHPILDRANINRFDIIIPAEIGISFWRMNIGLRYDTSILPLFTDRVRGMNSVFSFNVFVGIF